ncbi:MAG: rubrerythrin, partial [Bacteroidales bacterium]|nr:rubrerythrin [Bacteroidales bacterium]
MKPFNNLDDILDFAIDMEQKSIEFYNDLAQKAKANDMKETFYNFVEEEIKHKAKLVKIKEEKVFN